MSIFSLSAPCRRKLFSECCTLVNSSCPYKAAGYMNAEARLVTLPPFGYFLTLPKIVYTVLKRKKKCPPVPQNTLSSAKDCCLKSIKKKKDLPTCPQNTQSSAKDCCLQSIKKKKDLPTRPPQHTVLCQRLLSTKY